MSFRISPWRWVAGTGTLVVALGLTAAVAQIPSPPSTVYGSVTDESGPVAENLPVVGYIGDKVCGTRGYTQFTGDGAAKVTVYFVDVLSAEQTAGCGTDGAEIRVKIGDRFATQTTKWKRGPVQLDITFGNVTPAPIPTFTPTATRPPQTNAGGTPVPGGNTTPGAPASGGQQAGTIPAGSPGAGSPVPTLKGGVTSSNQDGSRQASAKDDGGGFPLWGVALLVLVGIAAVGGGIGYSISRSRAANADLDDPLR